jgi:hypothetical protein
LATNVGSVLIAEIAGQQLSAIERAEQAFAIERATGEKSGKQDNYAASLAALASCASAAEMIRQRSHPFNLLRQEWSISLCRKSNGHELKFLGRSLHADAFSMNE